MRASMRKGLMLTLLLLLGGATFWLTSSLGKDAQDKALALADTSQPQAALAAMPLHGSLPPSASALTNAGVLAWQIDEPAQAIAYWRSAQQLSPRDIDIQHNLMLARRQLSENASTKPLPPIQAASRLNTIFSAAEWGLLATFLWLLASALSIEAYRRRDPSLGSTVSILAVLGLSVVITIIAWQARTSLSQPIVVTRAASVLRDAPSLESSTLDTIPAYSELRLLAQRGDYIRVRSRHDQSGWLIRDTVATVPARIPPLSEFP